MSLIHLENDNLESEISSGRVLLDFYAEWCGPCKMLAPVLESLSKKDDIKIIKIDTDKYMDLAMKYNVMSIPKLVYIKDGSIIRTSVGFLDEEEISEMINE